MTTSAPKSRVSTSVAVKIADTIGSTISKLVAGAMLFIPGLYVLLDEINSRQPGEQVHKLHIYLAVGLMVGGALCINPPFGKQISGLVVSIFPNGVPLLGGRRASDPQPEAQNDKPA